MPRDLDLDAVRRRFPALANGWAFFDNAGGSQVLGAVASRISEYLVESMVAHGAPYAHSRLGKERLHRATERFATLLNAGDPATIIMGGSSTQLEFNLGLAMASMFEPGDEIVLSQAEHHANIEPWLRLARRGVVLKTWTVNRDSWQLELDELERLMTDKTRLVAFTHCSNVLGTIHDVVQATQFIHARGAQVFVDGVAYAPHGAVDVRAWDVDYYIFSTYKLYGPHHAVLYGKREHLLALENVNHAFIPKDMLPYKFQPGNANSELSHGSTAVVDYLVELGRDHGAPSTASEHEAIRAAYDAVAIHEEKLSARLLGWLDSKPQVQTIGSPSPSRRVRLPIISFVVDGVNSATIPERLAPHKIAVRSGDFYAKALARDFDLDRFGGVVRVSMAHYNTLDEVDRLIRHLDTVLR